MVVGYRAPMNKRVYEVHHRGLAFVLRPGCSIPMFSFEAHSSIP